MEDGKQAQEVSQKEVEPEFQNFAIEKTANGAYKVTLKDVQSVSNMDRLAQSAKLEDGYTGTDGSSFTFSKRINASNFARNNDGRVERSEKPSSNRKYSVDYSDNLRYTKIEEVDSTEIDLTDGDKIAFAKLNGWFNDIQRKAMREAVSRMINNFENVIEPDDGRAVVIEKLLANTQRNRDSSLVRYLAREKLYNSVKHMDTLHNQKAKELVDTRKRELDAALVRLKRDQRMLDYERWLMTNDERTVQEVNGFITRHKSGGGTKADNGRPRQQGIAAGDNRGNGRFVAGDMIAKVPESHDKHHNDKIIKEIRSEYAEQQKTKPQGHSDNQGALSSAKHFSIDGKPIVGVRKYSAAWHGTEHDFETFTLDAVGTGSGGQEHGHGLYFSENRAPAEGYRERLGKGKGHLFEVNIPEKDVMIDEDKTFLQQPPKVQEAIRSLVSNLSYGYKETLVDAADEGKPEAELSKII